MKFASLTNPTSNRRRLLVLSLLFVLVDLVRGLVNLDTTLSHTEKTDVYRASAPTLFLLIGDSPWLVSAIGAIGAVALTGFAWNRRPLLNGSLLLAALFLLSESLRAQWGGPSRAMYAQGAVLLGWVLGMGLAVSLGRVSPKWESPRGEWVTRLAEWGGLGVLCGYYVNAGLSKMVASGFDWFGSGNLRSVVVVQSAQSPDILFAPYVEWVVSNPWVCQAMSVGTVAIELGAFLLLLGPRIRLLWGCLLLLMHINIGLLTGSIWYLGPMILLAAYMLPLQELPLGRVSARALGKMAAGVGSFFLLLVCLAWLTPIGDYARETFLEGSAGSQTLQSDVKSLPEAGPLIVGMTVTKSWKVHGLETRGRQLRVVVHSSERKELVFVLEAEKSDVYRSAFQLPGALPPFWFYYENTRIGFERIRPVGEALLGILERGCDGGLPSITECLPVPVP